MQTTETPQVFVACLAAYNAGELHGEWIDATDEDEMNEAIQKILSSSPEPDAEEWIICDHDNFHDLSVYQYAPIDEVARLGALVEEHGQAFAAYAAHTGQADATEEGFQDHYQGHWDSEKAFGEEMFDECYLDEVPESVRPYIDYEKFARDLFINDYFSVKAEEGGVYVFNHS